MNPIQLTRDRVDCLLREEDSTRIIFCHETVG